MKNGFTHKTFKVRDSAMAVVLQLLLVFTNKLRKGGTDMTRNQIEYAKLRETQRSNLESERLTGERDRAARELGINTLAETSRHNKIAEVIDRGRLDETSRHNLAVEGLEQAKQGETHRSNVAREAETQRANLAGETIKRDQLNETTRHNKVTEGVDIGRAATYAGDAAARALHNAAMQAETTRHNMVMETKSYAPQIVTPITVNSNQSNQPTAVEVPRNRTIPNPSVKPSNKSYPSTNGVPKSGGTNRNRERSLIERGIHGIIYGDDMGRWGDHNK